ncbi:translation initiation factor eif-2b alpha [Lasallia pustulata]|uniref:Translation initiation factor eIF2B subunit alpha n=1 Tax=Lasallia pustulata TaxID=136370 RepID=A0A1W5CW60_9LECA|nr:translation initiation factor eif-2b alpha [Lasallia pustulata]
MPIAAIDSLILLLSQSTSTTISETLSLLATSTSTLKHAIPNPISLSAGTDLFQRYLITTLQRPERPPHPSDSHGHDLRALRNHLLSNGRLFVQRAKESRAAIARFGKSFVRDGSVVLTNGGSRVVGALLKAAAEDREGSVRFRVIYVLGQCAPGGEVEGAGIVRELRRSGVPVATVPEAAVAYSMGKVDVVIVGAEGVVENGGVISRLGTFQIGVLARSAGKPFYVVAESHKFVRLYPLGQYDLPIEQKVVDFTTVVAGDEEGGRGDEAPGEVRQERWTAETPVVKERREYFGEMESTGVQVEVGAGGGAGGGGRHDAVDFTPPDLITALITESGVLTPSAVSEELIKIWY